MKSNMKKLLAAILLALLTPTLTACSGSLSKADIRGAGDIGAFSAEGVAPIKTADGKYGYIDYTGKTVAAPQWDYAETMENGAVVVRLDGKPMLYGGVNAAGKVIVPVEYTALEWFPAEAVFVGEKKTDAGTTCYLIDANGGIVSQGQWDDIGRFDGGRAAVKQNGKWGVIDAAGKVVVKPNYSAMYVSGDTMWTYIDDALCRIDANGNVLFSASNSLSQVNQLARNSGVTASISGHPHVTIISDTAIAVPVYMKTSAMLMGGVKTYAFITERGVSVPLLANGYAIQMVMPYTEDSIIVCVSELKMGGTYGNVLETDPYETEYAVVRANGTVIIAPGTYKYIDHLHQSGVYYMTAYGNKGMMKPDGTVIIRQRYDSIEPFYGKLAAFEDVKGWGYLDRSGNVVIPAQYEKARGFGGGYAAVKQDGQWYIIDSTGAVVY